jgi:hypothetical protein
MSDEEAALLIEENLTLKKEHRRFKTQLKESREEHSRLIEDREHLKEQNAEFLRLHAGQQRTIAALQERVRFYIRKIYGRKSEKIDVTQMVFDDIILAAERCLNPHQPAPHPDIVEEKVREHIRRKHPSRRPLPPELPRVEHYLDIPEEEKYTADGKERKLIGVDITEKLDYRPSSLVVNRYIRPKYGAGDDIEGRGVRQHPPVDFADRQMPGGTRITGEHHHREIRTSHAAVSPGNKILAPRRGDQPSDDGRMGDCPTIQFSKIRMLKIKNLQHQNWAKTLFSDSLLDGRMR